MPITYALRWKEELVGTVGGHTFVVEATMGVLHVYFPTEATWNQNPPDWARGLWAEAYAAAQAWCEAKGIPFTSDATCWVDF